MKTCGVRQFVNAKIRGKGRGPFCPCPCPWRTQRLHKELSGFSPSLAQTVEPPTTQSDCPEKNTFTDTRSGFWKQNSPEIL